MEATTAVSKVLLTVELAEQILSYLPFQSLVHAELACRTWKEIIDWSSALQQGLYLEPTKHHLSIPYQSKTKLRRHQWEIRTLNINPYKETYTIAMLHPYLINDLPRERRGLIAFTFDWRKALKLREEGRWKGMFVTQPPCRNVKVEFQVGTRNALFTGRSRVTDLNGGVRLGLLVDRVRDILENPAHHGELQPMSTASPGPDESDRWLERLDCYVDGFISEDAAVALAKKAAEAPARRRVMNLE